VKLVRRFLPSGLKQFPRLRGLDRHRLAVPKSQNVNVVAHRQRSYFAENAASGIR